MFKAEPRRFALLAARSIVALILTMNLNVAHLAAQTTTATVLGVVTDSSGAAIPEATVRVTNTGTAASQTTTSDAEGRFRVPALPVGEYDVEAEKAGFEAVVQKGITLTVGGQQVVDFSLPVGQVTQTITVEGDVSQVETTSAAISNLVEPTQMRELPLNGRDFEQLVLLSPGVTIMSGMGGSVGFGFGNAFSVSGSRTRGQWELLDDNDVMDFAQRGSGSGILGTSLGVDAIAEFSVLTNTYSAQYGGNGAVINSVTKSGTNNLHGSGYEFFRNSALDARNFFDPAKIPEFQKNQFGATLGGPIKKDKMFFFVNYEGLRQNTGETYAYILPDAAAHLGYLPNAGGIYQCVANAAKIYPDPTCAASISPNIQKLLTYFPAATSYPYVTDYQSNGNINGLDTASELFNAPAHENYVVGRYDWNLSAKNSVFARYLIDLAGDVEADNTSTLSPLAPTGWAPSDTSKNQFLSIEEKHIWSSNIINSARFGFSRTLIGSWSTASYGPFWQFENAPSPAKFPAELDGSVTILPLMNANVPHTNLGGGSASLTKQNKFAGGEDIFWTKGAHNLRFGASVTRVQSYKFSPQGNGTWTFANMTNFLTDFPTNFSGTCLPLNFPATCNGYSSAPAAPDEFMESDFGFYIQDDWKVRNTVTLNIGLRYEPTTNPTEAGAKMQAAINLPLSATFKPGLPMPGCMAPTAAAPISCPLPLAPGTTGFTPLNNVFLQNPSLHNFDPRIGIAWDPFKDHKTSVRAGYGIFHSPMDPYSYTSGFTNSPPGTNVTITCATQAACSSFPTPFQIAGTAPTPTQDGGIDDGDRSTGYMQQYNLTVQREIAENTTVSVGYVGSHGVHLLGAADENPNLPTGVPGAITVCAVGCNMKPGQVLLPYPAVGALLTSGACSTIGAGNTPGCPGLASGAAPASATGKPIVDPTTGQNSYSNVVYNPTTNSYSVVANNRIDPAVGFWNLYRDTFWSRYNSLQAGLVRRLTNNLQAQISYTYASCFDTSSASSSGFEGDLVGQNAWNVNGDKGYCHYLVRHNFYVNGVYNLPFRGNRLVTGWELSGIFQYHTGTPLDVTTGWNSGLFDRAGSASLTGRPNVVPGCNQVLGTVAHWSNAACYTQPAVGEPGDSPRYEVFGPDSMTFDTSLVKNTRLSERFNVQFRAEFFNVFNRPNFRNSGQNAVPIFSQATAPAGSGLSASSLPATCFMTPSTCSNTLGSVGSMSLTNTTSRQIQFGLKVLF